MKIKNIVTSILACSVLALHSCGEPDLETTEGTETTEALQAKPSISSEEVKALSDKTSEVELVSFSQLQGKLRAPTIVVIPHLPVGLSDENASLKRPAIEEVVKKALPVGEFGNEGNATFLVTYITGQGITFSRNGSFLAQHSGIYIETRLLAHGIVEASKGVFRPVLAELGRGSRVLTQGDMTNANIKRSIEASVNEIFAVNKGVKTPPKLHDFKLSDIEALSFLHAQLASITNSEQVLSNLKNGHYDRNTPRRDAELSPPKNIPFSKEQGLDFSARNVPWMSATSLSSIVFGNGQDAPNADGIWESAMGSFIKYGKNIQKKPKLIYSLKTHKLGWTGESYTSYDISYTSVEHPSVLFSSNKGIFSTTATIYSRVSQVINEANARTPIEVMIRNDAVAFSKATSGEALWEESSVSSRDLMTAINQEFLDVKKNAITQVLPDVLQWIEGRRDYPIPETMTQDYALHIASKLVDFFPRDAHRREVYYYGTSSSKNFSLHAAGSEKGRDTRRVDNFIDQAVSASPLTSSLFSNIFSEYAGSREVGAVPPNILTLIQESPARKKEILDSVRVRDLFSVIVDEIWYEREQGEILEELESLENELAKAKVLYVTYTGKNGLYGGGKRRFAWYGIKPKTWLKIREKLTHKKFAFLKDCLDSKPQLSPLMLLEDQNSYQADRSTFQGADELAKELVDAIDNALISLKKNQYNTSEINTLCEHLRLMNRRLFKPVRPIPDYGSELITSAVAANIPSALVYKAESCLLWNGKGYVAAEGELDSVLEYLKKAAELNSGIANYWLAELCLSEQIEGGRKTSRSFAEAGVKSGDHSSKALLKLMDMEDNGLLGVQPRKIELELVNPLEAGIRICDPLSIYVAGRNGTRYTTKLRQKRFNYQRARMLGSGRAAPPKF